MVVGKTQHPANPRFRTLTQSAWHNQYFDPIRRASWIGGGPPLGTRGWAAVQQLVRLGARGKQKV